MGEVSRIIFHQLRRELDVAFTERGIDLASGCIFGEVTRRRQAPIERERLRRARLVARLIEQIAERPRRERRFWGFRMRHNLSQSADGLAALAAGARNIH